MKEIVEKKEIKEFKTIDIKVNLDKSKILSNASSL
jgi:hypothetical protein